jgi:hypothetical protein
MHGTQNTTKSHRSKNKNTNEQNTRIANEFLELREFKQSSSKHWNLLSKLEKGIQNKLEASTTIDNETNKQKIAEKFAESLEDTFKKSTDLNLDPSTNISNTDNSLSTIPITNLNAESKKQIPNQPQASIKSTIK